MVIVAVQMQRTVDNQMGEMVRRPAALGERFAAHRFQGENDITTFKGQDVGGLVDAAMARVQPADQSIPGKHDTEWAAARRMRRLGRAARDFHGVTDVTTPARIDHDDARPRLSGAASTGRVHR